MNVGELIKMARVAAGMTQADLSEKLGVPFQSVSQWERGTRNPKQATIQRIASALNIPVYSLMTPDAAAEAGTDLAGYEGEDMGNKRIFDITYHLAEGQKIGETFCPETEPPVLGLAEHFAGTAGYIVIQWDSGRFARFINKEAIQYIDVSGPQE